MSAFIFNVRRRRERRSGSNKVVGNGEWEMGIRKRFSCPIPHSPFPIPRSLLAFFALLACFAFPLDPFERNAAGAGLSVCPGVDLRSITGIEAHVGADAQAKISTQVFAPEARRTLAGGGAQRNHRDQSKDMFPAPEGRQIGIGLSPLRGWKGFFDSLRWFHHRLISGVPPGQRIILNLRRKSSMQVYPYAEGRHTVLPLLDSRAYGQ